MESQISKGRVFVVGAGGHGKVVIDALSSAGDFEIVGVIDDDEETLARLSITIITWSIAATFFPMPRSPGEYTLANIRILVPEPLSYQTVGSVDLLMLGQALLLSRM